METTKQIEEKKMGHVVMKPSIAETLRAIQPGESFIFHAGALGRFSSVWGQAQRLNSQGLGDWQVTTTDNGASYEVARVS